MTTITPVGAYQAPYTASNIAQNNQVSFESTKTSSLNQDTVSFTGKKENQEVQSKPKATTGKKIGVGLASFLIPGLGQAINGQWGKAAGFFFGAGALIAMAPALGPIAGLGLLAVGIGTIVDAVKNAKSKKLNN